METPDRWVILRINSEKPFYKVLCSWGGSYIYGPSWRMNSGIDSIEEDKHYWYFVGASGSIYKCNKEANTLSATISEVYSQLKELYGDLVELVEGDDWMENVG